MSETVEIRHRRMTSQGVTVIGAVNDERVMLDIPRRFLDDLSETDAEKLMKRHLVAVYRDQKEFPCGERQVSKSPPAGNSCM